MPTSRAHVASDRSSQSQRIASARSLAEDVRARSDDQIAALLNTRPDLALPPPSDLTSLVGRATTRASTQRALDGLDRGHLQVLEALAVAGDPVDLDVAAGLLGISSSRLDSVVAVLWDLALVWRGPDGAHVTRSVLEALGQWPAGLGPPILALRGSVPAVYRDASALDALLDQAPETAKSILEQLTWGPPVGHLRPSGPLAEGGQWLLTHQLVTAHSADHVLLPREVGLRLRNGRLHRATELTPPAVSVREVGTAAADRAAGGAADQLLGLVDELCLRWADQPPRVLRAGGLAVRDLRVLRSALDVPEELAAFVVEIGYAAGLVADDGSTDPSWAPTPSYDDWTLAAPAARWARLVSAWTSGSRATWLVGSAPDGGTVNALSRDILWPQARVLRLTTLAELAGLPAGGAPATADVVDRVCWRRPLRRRETTAAAVQATLREAEWLGVTGRGALGSAGRLVAAEADSAQADFGSADAGQDVEAVAQAIEPHLPAPVDHVLLQADLTAVAPGRVEGLLARVLRLLADVESRGGATVHRFTPASIRRGLDAGWSSEDILAALADASTTPVPQPLAYLVADVARRHGSTRVGTVAAYLRSDDTATLDAILADRRLQALRLRRLAPTVLVSPVEGATVVAILRDHGLAPVIEGADGAVLVPAAVGHRTPHRRPVLGRPAVRADPRRVARLVADLRAGEHARDRERAAVGQQPGPRLSGGDPLVTITLLREAAADRQRVWIGYADQDGRAARLLFLPRRVEAGRAFGTVEGSELERSFSVRRITGVAPA